MSASGYIVSALTGGLAGSTLTLLIQSYLRWRSRPILEIVFQSGEPGCDVKTHGFRVDNDGDFILHEGQRIEVQQRYLRLKLKNSGRTFAENCSVCITEIEFGAPGQGRRVFEEEILDLGLALSGSTVFNLAAGGHRFLDLARTHDDPLQGHSFGVNAAKVPVRLGPELYGAGRYRMKVFVAANNASSVSREIEWSYDGPAGGLRII
jgi:hypothetical protein